MSNEGSLVLERIRDALTPGYRVERELGVGGMAVVFLAQDTKHDRPVAIKVLRAELAPSIGAARFEREIRVAARLTHPNILPLLDSGMVAGMPYYAMPFVSGESLRVRLDRSKTIPLAEALVLTREIADALHYAHAAGIIHRDIKPENILLLDGHAIVADFGIARAVDASSENSGVTSVGIVMGTPAYMSPEQAAGDPGIDGRTDIYALALIVYEMLCGAPPFTAKSASALIARRFMETAPRISARVPDIPSQIDDAVASALALDVDARPSTARAFSKLLVAPGDAASVGSGASVPVSMTTAAMMARSGATQSNPAMPSVAVLPFANLSSDPENEFLSDGITEEIMNALGRMRTLRVAGRTSSFAFKGRRDDVRAIATQLGVTTVLDGSVRRAGARVRVSAQLIDARSGDQLWADQMDRQLDDAFAIQDDIAGAIASALRATLIDARGAAHAPTIGAAYESYLRGRFALNKRTEPELLNAVAHFEAAKRLDPEFALAYAGLGDAQLVRGVYGAATPSDAMPKARAAAMRAIEIDPSLPEAYATLGSVRALFDWDWAGADDAFRRAIAVGPRYPTAYQWNAINHFIPRGRMAEARAAAERARSLDPLAMTIAASVGVVYHLAGDAPGAVRALNHAIERDASFAIAHYFLGGALRDTGDLDASAAAFHAAMALGTATPEMSAGLAQTLAAQGDRAGAMAFLDALYERAATRTVGACLRAQVHASLGEVNEALDMLGHALAEREPELVFIGVRTAYAPLRGNARFDALRAQIGV